MSTSTPRTLFQKIWDAHIVAQVGENGVLLYIDRHLVNEVTSPQAFEGLRERGLAVRRPDLTMAVADHNVPTIGRAAGLSGFADRASRLQVEALERNVAEFGVPYIPLNDPRQGIVHVVGPELGFTLPGTTIVCGDSHTSTHGAFGALAFGIGTSEVEQVLATQCIVQRRAKSMLVHVEGVLGFGVTAKDLILAIVARIGASGAAGHVVEYAGPGISALDMSERMTVCNMSIEAGARAGMIAPDLKALHWLAGRPLAPKGAAFVAAESAWLALRSDDEAVYDRVVSINASEVAPMVSWGTSPDAAVPITGTVPLLADLENASRPSAVAMMEYMGLTPGSDLAGLSIDAAFIGSCTNGRIEDLRAAASVARGRRVATGVRALVVPGSGAVKAQAEREGLDEIFTSAGFEWRDAGCSMCLGMNADRLAPGQRCASSSNRNFEGRQGPGARTHLMSPAMVAAAAVTGRLVDVRSLR